MSKKVKKSEVSLLVKVKTNKKTGENYIDINVFKNFFNISKIDTYELTTFDDNTMSLRFFDKKGKLLKPK